MTIDIRFVDYLNEARLNFDSDDAPVRLLRCRAIPHVCVALAASETIVSVVVTDARAHLPSECLGPTARPQSFTYARSIDMAYVALTDVPDGGVASTIGCFGLPGGRVMNVDQDAHGRIVGLEFDAALGVLGSAVLDRATPL